MYGPLGTALRDTSAPPMAQTPALADDEHAFHLARFLAVCVSVHADALECAVDETANALVQIASEERAMCDMEGELRELTARSERLCTMREAIARSRQDRSQGMFRLREHSSESSLAALSKASCERVSRKSRSSSDKHSASHVPSPQQQQQQQQHRPHAASRQKRLANTARAVASFVPSTTQPMNGAGITQLASRAIVCNEYDQVQDMMWYKGQTALSHLTHTSNTLDKFGGDASGVNVEVDEGAAELTRVQSRIRQLQQGITRLECYGMKSKLRRLEAQKARVRSALESREEGVDTIEDRVRHFCFAPHVEALWSSGSKAGKPSRAMCSSKIKHRGNNTHDRFGPYRSRRKDACAPHEQGDEALGSGSNDHETQSGCVSSTAWERQIGAVLSRACQRLARRYNDAMEAIVQAEWSEQSDLRTVYECMLYSHALEKSFRSHNAGDWDSFANPRSSRRANDAHMRMRMQSQEAMAARADAAAAAEEEEADAIDDAVGEARFVHELQKQGLDTVEGQVHCVASVLAEYRCCSRGGNPYDESAAADAGSANDSFAGEMPDTVLSKFDFCALPADWAGVRELIHLDPHTLLPSARHILTARFSFADVHELKQLQLRRVDVQRRLVHETLDWESVYHGMTALELQQKERLATRITSRQDRVVPAARAGRGASSQATDDAVAALRRAVHELASHNALHAYIPRRCTRRSGTVREGENKLGATEQCIPSKRLHDWLTVMKIEE